MSSTPEQLICQHAECPFYRMSKNAVLKILSSAAKDQCALDDKELDGSRRHLTKALMCIVNGKSVSGTNESN
ncbi:MAG TPA: hypothetical protein ENI23_17550 [bacterium]|nr:hypothetical protein [bacterium]